MVLLVQISLYCRPVKVGQKWQFPDVDAERRRQPSDEPHDRLRLACAALAQLQRQIGDETRLDAQQTRRPSCLIAALSLQSGDGRCPQLSFPHQLDCDRFGHDALIDQNLMNLLPGTD